MPISELAINVTAIIMIANIVFAFILIFLERRNPTVTWAWLLVLVFIPILGFLLYLFLGQDTRKKKLFTQKADNDLKRITFNQSIMLKNDIALPTSLSKEDKDIVQLHLNNAYSVYTQNNNVTILSNGDDKFPALINAIEQAQDHIHLEYYIIRDDTIGRKIRNLLAKKASQGVEVRLLYDGMGCIRLPRKFFRSIIDAGGEIAEFYPPFVPYINIRINYRNHRKIVVIDGRKAFIGGLNIGDEYLGKSPKYGFWRDTHLMIEGNSVDYLQLQFMMDWKFASNNILPYEERYFPHRGNIGNTGIQIVSSGPDSKWESIKQGYFKMITKAQKNIYIQTPYFVPDDSLLEALKTAALGGIDVRIMIPCKPDHPFVYWASTSYISELLEAGAKVYTYMNGFLHGKLIMVDGRIGSVGTANMDIRSFKLNFEVNAFIYDSKVISKLEDIFIQDLLCSRNVTPEYYSRRSIAVKFKESVSRLLSPLL